MSDTGEHEAGGQGGDEARQPEWAGLQQELLREEVQRRKEFRELFEAHEKVIAEKVRQLRTERGWSQDDLARRMEELGWPMHQTTVAKLEAAKRPIRAAEVYALAMVFGLPIQALWYLPVPGEPRSIRRMRDELRGIDDEIASTEQTLKTIICVYADQKSERLRLAQVMNEAAKSGPDSMARPGLDSDTLRGLADALSARDRTARRLAGKGIPETEARERGRAKDPGLAQQATDAGGA